MMARAIEDIKDNKLSLRKASAKYGIPHPNMRKHLLKEWQVHHDWVVLDGFECGLWKELVKYMIDMQERFFGLSYMQVENLHMN